MNRRSFIKRSALASGTLMVPSFLKGFEALAGEAAAWKNLVIIQLSGGNDGLNTIVPFENDIYYSKRGSIAVPKNDVLKLSAELGFNPALKPLQELFGQGWMSIINDVGYPNPDRSHFRSLDIWHTASDSAEYLSSGWIGRYLDSNCTGCEHPHLAIEVDDTLSLALKGLSKKGIAVRDAKQLYNTTREPFFKNMAAQPDGSLLSDDNLGYLYKTMAETYSSAEYIYETSKTYASKAEYPQTNFARQLNTVATFINSGLKTRVYYVSLSGFDTHANQRSQQDKLLKDYAGAVAAFVKDLKQANKLDDTLIMTFSEFGRRVEQNASNGTDHGTAGNMFLFGSKLKKAGVFNGSPDLDDLDEGDLKFKVDFRSVYATVLDKWLGVSDSKILNKDFSKLDLI
ncbi:MAG: DUF1501 domain-containing protein [Bacteroidota bacterium]